MDISHGSDVSHWEKIMFLKSCQRGLHGGGTKL